MANLDNGVVLGQLGSLHTDGTGAVVPPSGMVIAAIQFISKNTPTALVAENPDKFFNTAHAANITPLSIFAILFFYFFK